MLPLFPEYQVGHHRFKEHHRIAILMAIVAPICATIFYKQLGWWNPWLWGCCGMGLALALCLHSVVMMIKKPDYPKSVSKSLIVNSQNWFPFFFVVIQSLIASLITMFVWFSISALVLDVPTYVHAVLVALSLMIPIRRYVWAKTSAHKRNAYKNIEEFLHGIWHILLTLFIANCILALTTPGAETASPNITWQIIIWVPAAIYMLYTAIAMLYHLKQEEKDSTLKKIKKTQEEEEPVDRF